jgi:putative endonuclease
MADGGYVYILTNRPSGILYVGVTNDLIQREHNIKHWPRAWKVRMIVATNPDWNDLFESVTN